MTSPIPSFCLFGFFRASDVSISSLYASNSAQARFHEVDSWVCCRDLRLETENVARLLAEGPFPPHPSDPFLEDTGDENEEGGDTARQLPRSPDPAPPGS